MFLSLVWDTYRYRPNIINTDLVDFENHDKQINSELQ